MAAPTLTQDDVRRVAQLARLALDDADLDVFTRQLGDILEYAAEVQRIDTAGVPPTSHPLASAPVMRDDIVEPCLAREDALRAAPDAARDAGLFRVPKVL